MDPLTPYHPQAMSEEQVSSLPAKLKDDAGLQEKLKGAGDLDAAVAIAKEVGLDVNKSDWLKYQASKAVLSDEELKDVAGVGAQAFDNCVSLTQEPSALTSAFDACVSLTPKAPG